MKMICCNLTTDSRFAGTVEVSSGRAAECAWATRIIRATKDVANIFKISN